ncbi:single-stranded DNA-binding protein [Allochromatium vinosum]|uniref:single-stranded DNA-binding protein n=1 Tax=Allochromatium vinosum TaxID=1049 RepID=UPI0019081744|nr:single-stranded DNA-binding protein [Allochromatium vinosum]MBK1656509.1 single-stranded DNA-binding protein [Allochromatium vinosum]
MLIGNIYGRLSADPTEKTTRTGKPMALASVAVDVTGQRTEDGDSETLWVSLMAFGHQCEALLRAEKGQMVAAIGKLTRSHYTGRDDIERESWTLLAESVITAKSARPGGGRQRPNGDDRQRDQAPTQRQPPAHDFHDSIPF